MVGALTWDVHKVYVTQPSQFLKEHKYKTGLSISAQRNFCLSWKSEKIMKNNIKMVSNSEICLSSRKKWQDVITSLWSTPEHLNKHNFKTKDLTRQDVGYNYKPKTSSCSNYLFFFSPKSNNTWLKMRHGFLWNVPCCQISKMTNVKNHIDHRWTYDTCILKIIYS